MAEELTRALTVRADRGRPRGPAVVLAEAQQQVTTDQKPRPFWRRGPALAIAVAAVTILVGVAVLFASQLLIPESSPVATAPDRPEVPTPATPAFDFSTDSLCDWFTAEDMDRIVAAAQDRVGTALELASFAPDGSCDAGRKWTGGIDLILERAGPPPAQSYLAFTGHEQLHESIGYRNLGFYGDRYSIWPPYGMHVDLMVDGHEDDFVRFVLEIWGPAGVAGSQDLDDDTLASFGFAVADEMLRDMHWTDSSTNGG